MLGCNRIPPFADLARNNRRGKDGTTPGMFFIELLAPFCQHLAGIKEGIRMFDSGMALSVR
jgi:hypothetical protein